MRILWFTNILMPDVCKAFGQPAQVVGGWMPSLLSALLRTGNVEMAVAAVHRDLNSVEKMVLNGVTYYLLPKSTEDERKLTERFKDYCTFAIKDFVPDLVHIHGTENLFGLYTAQERPPCPVVISIQGLLHVCYRHVLGGLTFSQYLEGGKEGLLAWGRFILKAREWARRGDNECSAIAGNRHFIGRTLWDHANVTAINPAAKYYFCNELLRPPFYAATWDIGTMSRHTIFCPAAHSPLKGFHWVLPAIAALCHEFPSITVRVAGAPWSMSEGKGYYGRYMHKLINKYCLAGRVVPLPALSDTEMATELQNAHAFVIPSLIENSSNSLAEAMLVGTPCIAAFVGGIPSMVADGEDALCFPAGDSTYLSHQLRRLFNDDQLARRLSGNARLVARDRHDEGRIVAEQEDIYCRVIAACQGDVP
jgi:glycosyltransferase involved in cell wall biosynthesis